MAIWKFVGFLALCGCAVVFTVCEATREAQTDHPMGLP
jgi:hypothetical protein